MSCVKIATECGFFKGYAWLNPEDKEYESKILGGEIGGEYVVRNAAESRNLEEVVVTFTCVKEDYVVWRFLLNTADNRVLMSATLGGIEAFSENIGVKYLEKEFNNDDEEILYRVIPSTFDFSKSPIYFLNRYKMSGMLTDCLHTGNRLVNPLI